MRILLIVPLLVGLLGVAAPAVTISRVYRDPLMIEPLRGEGATIHFLLSAPARVTLHLYDGQNACIRSIRSEETLSAGAHTLTWDGRDALGRPVPPEAYVYAIEATAEAAQPVVWDLTDRSGGRPVAVEAVDWNAASEEIVYRLPQPARVRIRVGLKNHGPLLRTVADWVARPAGSHAEAWDGWDSSRVLDLRKHPSLLIHAEAVSLPDNVILVGPSAKAVYLINDLPDPQPRRESTFGPLYGSPHQAMGRQHDFPLQISLVSPDARTHTDLPIVGSPVIVRLNVADEHRPPLLRERFEVMLFVDGVFMFENETGFLPVTWTWDPAGANPGPHYVTANLLGYEGQYGMATLKLELASSGNSSPGSGNSGRVESPQPQMLP
jgi:hypothetical protein